MSPKRTFPSHAHPIPRLSPGSGCQTLKTQVIRKATWAERFWKAYFDLSTEACRLCRTWSRGENLPGSRLGERFVALAVEKSAASFQRHAVAAFIFSVCLVTALFAVSCSSPLPTTASPQPTARSPYIHNAATNPNEPLYIKRTTTRIAPTEPGSHTGSLFADSQRPRLLTQGERPQTTGDVITILIPDELQPKKTSSNPTPAKKKADVKEEAENATSPEDKLQSLADSLATAVDPNAPLDEVRRFRMEVINQDPNGHTYLRGVKRFQSTTGEAHEVSVLARIPTRQLNAFEVDARELDEVELEEVQGARTASYRALEWDPLVTRKLMGFTPDVSAAASQLDNTRRELDTTRKALSDQAKALAQERERVRKDRERLSQEQLKAQSTPTPTPTK